MSYLRSAQNSLVTLEKDVALASATQSNAPEGLSQSATNALSDILADVDVAWARALSESGKRKTAEIRFKLENLEKRVDALPRLTFLRELSELDASFDVAVEIFAGDGFRFRKDIGNLIDSSVLRVRVMLVFAVATAILISLSLAHAIVPPLNRAVGVARSIAGGKLDNLIVPHGKDETAILLSALATMQESIAEKIAHIGDLMKSQANRYDGKIALQGARFEAALNNMSQGLCMFDENERLVVYNKQLVDMFGNLEIGRSAGEAFDDPDIQHLLSRSVDTALMHELSDGRIICLTRQPVLGGGWVDTFEDVTERHRAEQKLTHMALHDTLTDLPNRVQLREMLEATLQKCPLVAQTAILCLDLDGFKSVNDTLGHPVGDALLRATAERLVASVDHGDLVARVGGDEFSIVLRAANPAEAAERTARRIINALNEPFAIGPHQVSVGVSIGIMLPGRLEKGAAQSNVDGLIKNADLALYRAKVEGRGTYRFFEAEMDARLQARRALELDLRAAIENDELELFYQPFVDTVRRVVSGFEALLRWRHPERGLVSPGEFIPVAEESGLMARMGLWVLETACRQAVNWPADLKISVNLSPVQFRSRTLAADVRDVLNKTGLDPRRLQLEVTESLLLQETEIVLRTLKALRDLGIAISMDDFGTGYSSLGYLSRFPFDKIKIDQSFVRSIEARENLAIIRAVIGLSRAMDIAVIAEGVETLEQCHRLQDEGCSEMQGYYFSRPEPEEELARLIIDVGLRLSAERSILPISAEDAADKNRSVRTASPS
ncbi:putative bifunctional diguanylate cyclase/phosphodiesterase [Jiella mangrovi]|uniref:EAL domain-containing protein n=1 Tax=Jiella mangrovi TaxID=2821407 RepID=A0ABS4BLG8_9HYPH|nr:EAL domain-containing protein [Jiella mangrovi]MBP0617577.1 EAL domain-containing protein [Jiella mangrovi]